MRTAIALCCAVGGLLIGCDRAEKPLVTPPKAPAVAPPTTPAAPNPEASKPKAVSEALIRYCSS